MFRLLKMTSVTSLSSMRHLCRRTPTLSGRGERMRASGPLERDVRQHRNLLKLKNIRGNHVGFGLTDDSARQRERLRSCQHRVSD